MGIPDPIQLYHPPHRDPHLACNDCWRPFYDDQSQPDAAWNKFVAHITGGLLRGSEVKRPDDLLMRREPPTPEEDLHFKQRSDYRLRPRGDRRKHKHI